MSVICHSAWPLLFLCPKGMAYSLYKLICFSGKSSLKFSSVTRNSTPALHSFCCQTLHCHKITARFSLDGFSGGPS